MVPAEQVYVTHCLPADSVTGRPGFQVRACSTSHAGLLDCALLNFTYLLPRDLSNDAEVVTESAPCRLALLPGPDGQLTLGHTAFKRGDTRGRSHNYFSHVLLVRELTLRDALQTWASPDWRLDYPQGESRSLSPFLGLPRPGQLNDALLTRFLRGEPGIEEPLSRMTFPPRLSPDALARRALLAKVLNGVQAVVREPASGRGRLYLLAEPGLVALLLYGVARLLPEVRDTPLTFTTYEPNDLALREYRLARVIGTYTGSAEQGLDEDYFTTRGFAIDTFSGRCSPELERALSPLLSDALALAADDNWDLLDDCFALAGREVNFDESLSPAIQAVEACRRIAAGHGRLPDLESLTAFESGQKFLRDHSDQVWPLIHQGSLTDPALCQEFADILRDHWKVLTAEASRALRGDLPGQDWRLHWDRLETLAPDTALRRQTFEEVLLGAVGEGGWEPGAVRFDLVRKWLRLAGPETEVPSRLRGLLLGVRQPEDITELLECGLASGDVSRLLIAGLTEPTTAAEARRHLLSGKEDRLDPFCRHIEEAPTLQAATALRALLDGNDGTRQGILERLLKRPLNVKAEVWRAVLELIGALGTGWRAFWCQGDRLRVWLPGLTGEREAVLALWSSFLEQVGSEYLVPGDPDQREIIDSLAVACHRLEKGTGAAEKEIRDRIAAWQMLRLHLDDPFSTPEDRHSDLIRAYKKLHLKGLLEQVRDHLKSRERDRTELVARLLATFRRFFVAPPGIRGCVALAKSWKALTAPLPEDVRNEAGYQFVIRLGPPGQHLLLVQEMVRSGLTGVEVHRRIKAEERKKLTESGPLPLALEGLAPPTPAPEPSAPASASRKAARPGRSGDRWVQAWVGVLVLGLVLAAGVVLGRITDNGRSMVSAWLGDVPDSVLVGMIEHHALADCGLSREACDRHLMPLLTAYREERRNDPSSPAGERLRSRIIDYLAREAARGARRDPGASRDLLARVFVAREDWLGLKPGMETHLAGVRTELGAE